MTSLVQATAESLLAKYGASPPVDVANIAEAEGVIIHRREMEDEVSGMLVRASEAAYIVVNEGHGESRQRFTIAHELGHFLLHRSANSVFVDGFAIQFREQQGTRRYDKREVQANLFAASLLMPAAWLRSDLAKRPLDVSDDDAIKELAQRYKVSPQALTIRLTQLALLAGFPTKPSRRRNRR